MIKLFGLCLTNKGNRYNHAFTENTLIKNYCDCWDQPFPSFANHNHKKAIGYTLLSGIFMEPDFMSMHNTMYIPENVKEDKMVRSFCYDYLYEKNIIANQKDYAYLENQLKGKIEGDIIKYYTNGAFIYNKNIVKRVFPDLTEGMQDGMIDINKLSPIYPGIYKIGEFVIYAHKFFRRGYSYFNTLNMPFLGRIEKLSNMDNVIKIAIDLDCIGLASVQKMEYEYSYWGGPKFDDNIENIKLGVSCFNNDNYNELLSEIRRTEMGWYIQDNARTFECEEITDISNMIENEKEYYGCRYVHSRVKKNTNTIIHLDGAIRAYNIEEMAERLDKRLNKAEKCGYYKKIWRIDGNIEINKWKELISHFYRDNIQISEYFNGVDEVIENEKTINNRETTDKDNTKILDLIPDNLEIESGIKCYISFLSIDKLIIPNTYDVKIIPTTTLELNQIYNTVESFFITFCKVMQTKGLKVSHCDSALYITYNDLVDNLPIIQCKSDVTANTIVEIIKQFVGVWAKRKDNRVITFSLQIPYNKKLVNFSFAGQIECFQKLFLMGKFDKFPNDENGLEQWIYDFYINNTRLFKSCYDHNSRSLIKNNNCLVYDRKFIDPAHIDSIQKDCKGLKVQMVLPRDDIEYCQKMGLQFSCAFYKEKRVCSKCGGNYDKCKCVLYIDKDVILNIKDLKILGYFWTNRKA